MACWCVLCVFVIDGICVFCLCAAGQASGRHRRLKQAHLDRGGRPHAQARAIIALL
jgi:hypothetical protein